MPSRRLTFDQQALIALEAMPYRMLTIEKIPEDEIIAELLAAATEWPKRTKTELRRRGPGTPTLRADLISIALGRTLRQGREAVSRDGSDLYHFTKRARLLRRTADLAGGADEDLVRTHEWPQL